MIGKCSNLTHVKHRGEEITEGTFEYKGCWNCQYFEKNDDFPYYDVEETAILLNKSKSTILNWIKNKKLDGRLFIKQKPEFSWGTRKKYYIKKESVEKLHWYGEEE